MQHAVFAAFFVVQHKLHRDARLLGPGRVGWTSTVANQVTRVGQGAVVRSHERWGAVESLANPIKLA